MKRYIYKNKNTGKKIYSDTKLTDVNLILVSRVGDTQIKSNDGRVIKK